METTKLFKDWYIELHRALTVHGDSDYLFGQLTMISSVLNKLLPAHEYRKLVTSKTLNSPNNTLL